MELNRIINLTQHAATKDQIDDGVIEPKDKDRETIKALLTFDEPPDADELYQRAEELVELALSYDPDSAMIGGAPYFMPPLEEVLVESGIVPLYSFSKRVSVEETDPQTGHVSKRSVFQHAGWVVGTAWTE